MLNYEHRKGRNINSNRFRKCCFPRRQANGGRADIQACIVLPAHPFFLSLKNRKSNNIWITVCSLEAKTESTNMETSMRFQIPARFRAAGETTTFHLQLLFFHLSAAWIVFMSDWLYTRRVCVLLNLCAHKPMYYICLCYVVCVCTNPCLHVCRFKWVCWGAASVSAEMHQYIWFLYVQLWWRLSTD